jgi:hypothetical protein
MATHEPWTFAEALASKPQAKAYLTDAEWYVCLVIVCMREIEGLDSGAFKFRMTPPNPEIQACFDAKMPPHHAAVELFSVRH